MTPPDDSIPESKTCPKCGVHRPIVDFGHDAHRPDGRAFYCKPCRRPQSHVSERYRCIYCNGPKSPTGDRCRKCFYKQTNPARSLRRAVPPMCPDCGVVLRADNHRCRECSVRHRWGTAGVDRPESNPSGLCQCGCGEPTALARATNRATGQVKGKPFRFIKGHQRRLSGVEHVVDPETGCWIWQRGMDHVSGYGKASWNGTLVGAHVMAYQRRHGPVPDGFVVHHICENKSCVNPDHLEALDRKAHAAAHLTWPGRPQEPYRKRWGVMRRAVAERSGGVCERCRSGPAEETHHLIPALCFERVEDAHDLGNLLHVCKRCHVELHREIAERLPLFDTRR